LALLVGFFLGLLSAKRCSRSKPIAECWSKEMQESEK
jgi:hypothetical protein